MSDQGARQQTPTRQARTRRKGTPRGGRHGLSRPVVPIDVGDEMELVQIAAPATPARSRRTTAERPPPAPALSREAEMAYVRADMRKLFVISGVLLALMLAMLALIGR